MCLYYYRDKDQKEIDLIYVEGDVLFPIEISVQMPQINILKL